MPRHARSLRFAAALLSAVSLTALASAAERINNLTDALVQAYASNPQLLAERARQRATDEQLAQANAGWRPKVTVNGQAFDTQTNAGGRTEGWNMTATVTQPVFQGGRVLAQRRQASANIEAGLANLTDIEQDVLLATVTVYMDVVQNSSVLALQKNSVEVFTRQLQAAKDRFDVGEVTRTDVAQAEAALAGGRTQLAAAQATYEASRAAFRRVIGAEPGELKDLPPAPQLPASLEEAVQGALAANPNLRAARATAEAADATVDIAVGALLPTVNLSASYARGETRVKAPIPTDTDTDSTTLSVSASIPLYQGGAEWSSIRSARAVRSQTQLLADLSHRSTAEVATNAWEQLQAARLSIASAEAQVTAQELAFQGVELEAQVGQRTTLDVLNSEQALLNARVTLVRSRRDAAVATYGLLAAVGQLNASVLGLPVELYDARANGDSVAGQLIGVGED